MVEEDIQFKSQYNDSTSTDKVKKPNNVIQKNAITREVRTVNNEYVIPNFENSKYFLDYSNLNNKYISIPVDLIQSMFGQNIYSNEDVIYLK